MRTIVNILGLSLTKVLLSFGVIRNSFLLLIFNTKIINNGLRNQLSPRAQLFSEQVHQLQILKYLFCSWFDCSLVFCFNWKQRLKDFRSRSLNDEWEEMTEKNCVSTNWTSWNIQMRIGVYAIKYFFTMDIFYRKFHFHFAPQLHLRVPT